MKKSLFLLLFANAYLFSSTAPTSQDSLFKVIASKIEYKKDRQYLDYVDNDGQLTKKANDLLESFVDSQGSLTPQAFKDLIHDICEAVKLQNTPDFVKTVTLVIKNGTKYQRAGMLFFGVFAAYGVVAACLNVKKKFFDKSNNS